MSKGFIPLSSYAKELLFNFSGIAALGFVLVHLVLLHFTDTVLISESNPVILWVETVLTVFWVALGVDRILDDIRK